MVALALSAIPKSEKKPKVGPLPTSATIAAWSYLSMSGALNGARPSLFLKEKMKDSGAVLYPKPIIWKFKEELQQTFFLYKSHDENLELHIQGYAGVWRGDGGGGG